MARNCCPTCQREPKHGWFYLHKCNKRGHVFCDDCANGDVCPVCGSDDIWWKHNWII